MTVEAHSGTAALHRSSAFEHAGARGRRLALHVVLHAVFIGLAILYVLPFLWMLSTSLKVDGQEMSIPPQLIPAPIAWDNYYRALTALMKTGVPGPEGSVAKLHWSEANQRLTALAVELLGPDGQLDGEGGFWNGYWQYQQLRSRGNTIEAGTSEILRNIVAERVLGLPRSR